MELYNINTTYPIIGACESGIGGRSENQDSYGYQDTPFGLLVTVCDGMGGGPAGKTASSIAVNEIIAGVMEAPEETSPMKVVEDAIRSANQAILKAVEAKPQLHGMGTTCTVALFNKVSAVIAHVGDSRVYQLRGHRKVFRTFDHSIVFEMVKNNVITEEQARLSDQSNIITRALGLSVELEVDLTERPYKKGDRFMLCSDGIHGMMPEKELIEKSTNGEVGRTVEHVVHYVDNKGKEEGNHHDNLTLVIVEMKSCSELKEPMKNKTTFVLGIIAAILAVVALLLNSCKNKDIDVATFKIESERVSPSTDTVGMVGTYDFPVEARRMDVNIGLEEDLSDATSHRVAVMGKDYSVTMRGLLPATTYYYCYSADFGLKSELMTETRSFTTSENVGYRIKLLSDPAWGGAVNGGGDYEEGQTCTVSATPAEGYVFSFWKENEIPLTQEPSYTFEVTESRILVARFAEIAALPVVITGEVTDITGATARGHGEVVGEGDSEVTERGVCWALHHMPTTSDSHAGNGAGTGAYTAEMTGLLDSTYYVRAYAINSEGTAYGEEKSFVSQLANYTISVSANLSNGGAVSGGGSFQHGQSCTVHANANTGYTFVNWTENGNQVSANANYTFTVNSNRTLVANFTVQPQNYIIGVSVNPSNGGTVEGGGTYQQGQSCIVSTTANSGFIFTNWTENGNVVSSQANYTFTVTGNRTLVANFQVQPQNYTISVSSNPSNGGTVEGGGTYQQGQSCTVSATANSEYTFLNWTENSNVVSTNVNYSFTVNGNRELVANFTRSSIGGWLYYDDGTCIDAIGLNAGGSFYWGIKFPADTLSQFEGCSVTKIGYYDYTAHTGTVRIYNGSNGNAPGTLIGTYSYTANGTSDWVEWTIPAVAFDNTQDLWIVMNNNDGQYVAALGPYTGDPNGTMLSTDGSAWYTLEDATGGSISGTWNLRAWVSNGRGDEIPIELKPNSKIRHVPSKGRLIQVK